MGENNDADKRPRAYGHVEHQGGVLEVTVLGAEGETSDDIADKFEKKVDALLTAREHMMKQDNSLDDSSGQNKHVS